MERYRFITNIEMTKQEMNLQYAAIKSAGITDYKFTDAVDIFGNPLAGHKAFYVGNNVSERDVELYHQVYYRLVEEGGMKHE